MLNVSLMCKHTPTQSVALFLSFPPFFSLFFSLIFSQLYRCLMFSPCCRERTEHLSSSGGMVMMVVGEEGAEPHALLRSWTLIPLGWKDARRLGTKPWPSARHQASTAPSPYHQIWAVSMWASWRHLFCWYLICCLFLRVCCRWAEKDAGEEIEERNMLILEISEEPLWPWGEV